MNLDCRWCGNLETEDGVRPCSRCRAHDCAVHDCMVALRSKVLEPAELALVIKDLTNYGTSQTVGEILYRHLWREGRPEDPA